MKWIIQKDPSENGSRSNQSWDRMTPPNGYLFCDEADIHGVYVEYRGFVNIEYEGNTVTSMTGNQEALDAYLAEHPDPEPQPEPEPQATTDEVLNALIGYEEATV